VVPNQESDLAFCPGEHLIARTIDERNVTRISASFVCTTTVSQKLVGCAE
jgi:hypothetical protein